ncbi:transcriptional regulator BetI, partial [Thioclava sp. BHET1]
VSGARRLLRVYQRRLQSNLVAELRPLVGGRARDIAEGIGAMIDGVYIREALSDEHPDGERAAALVRTYLQTQIAMRGI